MDSGVQATGKQPQIRYERAQSNLGDTKTNGNGPRQPNSYEDKPTRGNWKGEGKMDKDKTKEVVDQGQEAPATPGPDQPAAGAEQGGNDPGSEPNNGTAKVFTQEEVNRMMAREKQQGRAAALKELGLDPQNEKALSKLKAFLTGDEEEATGEPAQPNESELEQLRMKLIVAEAKADAMQAGVQPQYVDDVVALSMAKLTDETDLKSIIGEFKSKYPTWFGINEAADGTATLANGTGTPIKTTKKDKGGEMSLGERLAATRRSQAKKSSYWQND